MIAVAAGDGAVVEEGTESVTRGVDAAASVVQVVALPGVGPQSPWPYRPARPSCSQCSPPLVYL